jgi:hypothetical protein
MVSFEFIALVLTGLGLTASIIYYANILSNANKTQQLQLETRQAQLFMSLFDTLRSSEFRMQWHTVEALEWKDYDEFHDKYNPEKEPEILSAVTSLMEYFEGVGVLWKRGLIDISLVEDLLGNTLLMAWDVLEPIAKGNRLTFQRPTMWNDFEAIANELIERTNENT